MAKRKDRRVDREARRISHLRDIGGTGDAEWHSIPQTTRADSQEQDPHQVSWQDDEILGLVVDIKSFDPTTFKQDCAAAALECFGSRLAANLRPDQFVDSSEPSGTVVVDLDGNLSYHPGEGGS
jgi:hypothetical protein